MQVVYGMVIAGQHLWHRDNQWWSQDVNLNFSCQIHEVYGFIWSFLPKWCVVNWLYSLSWGSATDDNQIVVLIGGIMWTICVFMASCNIRSDVIFVTVTYLVVIYLVFWSTWSTCIFTFIFILFAIGCWLGGLPFGALIVNYVWLSCCRKNIKVTLLLSEKIINKLFHIFFSF
jgi:hypothetical protein